MFGRVGAVHLNGFTSERVAKRAAGLGERDPVLRALRAGERGLYGREVQLGVLGVDRFGGVLVVPHALGFGVSLDQFNLRRETSGEGEVVQGHLVDWKDGARRAVLGGHVANRGARLERERRDAGTEGLDELAHDAVTAK